MLLEKILITIALVIVLIAIVFIIIANKKIIEKLKMSKLKMLVSFHKDEEARKYALKFIEKYPKNFMAHKILAELYEKTEGIISSIQILERGLKDGGFEEFKEILAGYYIRNSQPEKTATSDEETHSIITVFI